MKNNRFKKIYKRLLDSVINNNFYCGLASKDNSFTFQNTKNRDDNIIIDLTEEEINNYEIGIYNEKTKHLKVLEYIYEIKNNVKIKPFQTIEDKQAFLTAIKQFNKISITKYIINLLKDFIGSLNLAKVEVSDSVGEIFAQLQVGLGFFAIIAIIPTLIFGFKKAALISLLIGVSPTSIIMLSDFIKKRYYRYKNYQKNLEYIDKTLINIDRLSQNLKQIKQENNLNISDKCSYENEIKDPIYNEIYNLLETLTICNLDNQIKKVFLTKIKEIKEEYIEKINGLNPAAITLENKYTIQQSTIQKLSIIEYELNEEIQKKNNLSSAQQDLDRINKKILLLDRETTS